MANKTNSTIGVRQKTHDSVDKIMDKAESMRNTGIEAMTHLREKAVRKRENVDSYIQENPEKSVLIAAGIGVVVGAMLVAVMMKRKH